jgi:hypothetical protein
VVTLSSAGAVGALVAAVASLTTVALTLWFRWHPRLVGQGKWILTWHGPHQVYKLTNNTGRDAFDVCLEGRAKIPESQSNYAEVQAGGTVHPTIVAFSDDPTRMLRVTWRSGRRRRHWAGEIPPPR